MSPQTGKKNGPTKKKKQQTTEDSVAYKKLINPSGTFLLYNLLSGYEICNSIEKIQTSYKTNLEQVLPLESKNNYPNIYFTITDSAVYNYEDLEWLMKFVSEGNLAFISSGEIPLDIFYLLSDDDGFNNYYDTEIGVNFYHPNLVQNENLILRNGSLNSHGYSKFQYWSYFDYSNLNENVVKLAYVSTSNFPIAVKVQYGSGEFIIHSAPSSFSNINMLLEEGKIHAETILSHFPKGNVFWHHDYGKYSPYRGTTQPTVANPYDNQSQYAKSSPLQYILKQPALFSALLLLISGILLYIIFQSKRRQRIIPAVETNENSTIEFVETVSKLYFQQKRHDKLIKHKEQIFLTFIKHHYYISSPEISDDFIQKVSNKSGIEKDKIKTIFFEFKNGKKNKFTTEGQLIALYTKLEYFYKNCN